MSGDAPRSIRATEILRVLVSLQQLYGVWRFLSITNFQWLTEQFRPGGGDQLTQTEGSACEAHITRGRTCGSPSDFFIAIARGSWLAFYRSIEDMSG